MSGLRERLEAKARRTATIQVAVEDTSEATLALQSAQSAYLAAVASNHPEAEVTAARDAVTAAEQALDTLFTDVALQALDPADYEALVDAHTRSDGELDRDGFLPPAVAASAVAEELRDESWWAEQLTSGRWASGELATLFLTITNLNDPTVRSSSVPKG